MIKQKPTCIVELGIGTGERTKQMLRLACQFSSETIHYTGIDLFESRTEEHGPGIRLKDAYRTLKAPNVKLQLMPGDPFSALSQLANTLPNTDLILISKCQDPDALEKAWFYVPRMVHTKSLILQEEPDGSGFREVPHDTLPKQASLRRAA